MIPEPDDREAFAAFLLRLRGKGMPRYGGYGAGDQIVTIQLEVPTELSPEQRAHGLQAQHQQQDQHAHHRPRQRQGQQAHQHLTGTLAQQQPGKTGQHGHGQDGGGARRSSGDGI